MPRPVHPFLLLSRRVVAFVGAVICVIAILASPAHPQTTWLDATSGTATISTNYTTGSAGLTLGLGFYVDYLIVAGGGGGGGDNAGGGGGGLLTNVGSTLLRVTSASNSVVVGVGGPAARSTNEAATVATRLR